jgi:hypothetical protein
MVEEQNKQEASKNRVESSAQTHMTASDRDMWNLWWKK